MKNRFLTATLIGMFMAACQSQDVEPTIPEADAPQPVTGETVVTQISDDVNSAEVKNILGSLFGKERGRSTDYTVSLLKDKEGKDRVICVNYSDNGGFALISAEKTHAPILAYAEEGNFSNSDDLPFPLNEWMDCTINSIAESENLPTDSLQKIEYMWRKYEHTPMPLVNDYPFDENGNLTQEEFQALSRIVMDKMAEWQSNGYRYYAIDNYYGTTSLGDKDGIGSFVQSIMYPPYVNDYQTFTFIVEKDTEYTTGIGHWMNTQWRQTWGYNQSFEFKSDKPNERIPVGCGPIAVGQVMYAYKYPSYYNWSAMTVSGYANKTTSDFLLDVYRKCNAIYEAPNDKNDSTGGTGCTQQDRVNALRNYGYRCDDMQRINYSQMLNNPAILASRLEWTDSKGKHTGNHAWVVEGGKCTESYTTTEVWTFSGERYFDVVHSESSDHNTSSWVFYVNWGWGGTFDAYYNLQPMVPDEYGYDSNTIYSGILNIRPI